MALLEIVSTEKEQKYCEVTQSYIKCMYILCEWCFNTFDICVFGMIRCDGHCPMCRNKWLLNPTLKLDWTSSKPTEVNRTVFDMLPMLEPPQNIKGKKDISAWHMNVARSRIRVLRHVGRDESAAFLWKEEEEHKKIARSHTTMLKCVGRDVNGAFFWKEDEPSEEPDGKFRLGRCPRCNLNHIFYGKEDVSEVKCDRCIWSSLVPFTPEVSFDKIRNEMQSNIGSMYYTLESHAQKNGIKLDSKYVHEAKVQCALMLCDIKDRYVKCVNCEKTFCIYVAYCNDCPLCNHTWKDITVYEMKPRKMAMISV